MLGRALLDADQEHDLALQGKGRLSASGERFAAAPARKRSSVAAKRPAQNGLQRVCLTAPARHSGETPPVDSRKVWRARGPAFRDRFERGRIRITRNFRTKALAVSGG